MGLRRPVAVGLGRVTHWGLRTVARRPASQLPGRVALAIDADVIGELAGKLRRGSIVVCGTNGKTTTNNLLADALVASGAKVLCNREGANMAPGVATALLAPHAADWAVLEADELSCPHILPALRPRYVVLLNLFRDQLDRAGEIDHVQDVLVKALLASPGTTLVACGDDPLAVAVAWRVRERGMRVVTFGIAEDLGLASDRVAEARFCQLCGAELTYDSHAFAQLGAFRCPACSFRRPELDFFARDVRAGHEGVTLRVEGNALARPVVLQVPEGGVYTAYNLLAALAASVLAGASTLAFRRVAASFRPHNGRLQRFCAGGREVVLNLAKNPTGFNVNIELLLADTRQKAVLFCLNDDFNDGRDISWIWDVDFERLAPEVEAGRLVALAGGARAGDVAVRMKYAGVSPEAPVARDVREALDLVREMPDQAPLYVLCNYSALAPAREELSRLGEEVS